MKLKYLLRLFRLVRKLNVHVATCCGWDFNCTKANNLLPQNVHHPDTGKTEKHQSEDTQCKKKKLKFLRFSLSMEDTEMGGLQEPSHPQPGKEEKDIEADCLFDDDLLHSLANMSLNLFDDQDFDADSPSCNSDWQLIESVVTPENAEITYSKKYSRIIYPSLFLFILNVQMLKFPVMIVICCLFQFLHEFVKRLKNKEIGS